MTEQPPEQISGHERNQAEFLREEFERNGRLGRDDIRWLLDIAEGKSEQPPEVPQREHEFIPVVSGISNARCSCGEWVCDGNHEESDCRPEWLRHIASLAQREEAPKPPANVSETDMNPVIGGIRGW